MQAPEHPEQSRRLAALREFDILDTPRESDFDDLTRLVAHICDAPVALISLVEDKRQWFKSAVGTDLTETGLDISICAHAILQNELFVVPDTLKDKRFSDNPLVSGDPHLRFYAGAPLASSDNLPLGTLCVLDFKPRELTESQKDALRCVARQVMAQLELRRSLAAQAKLLQSQREAQTALREANNAKDRFLAALSHELRTPLSPVVMIARSLQAEPNLSEAVREDLHVLLRNVELEAKLIDDLLDLTRISHGKMKLARRAGDIHEMIRQVNQTCSSGDIKSEHANIKLELNAEKHWFEVDSARFQQVLWNLLNNAIKFSPQGSPIVIATRNDTDDTGETRLVIEISDRGAGIEPRTLSVIFDAFQQGGADVTRRYGGLGLGLAISKAIVEMHGGTLSAHSAGPATGATFKIAVFPATATPATSESPARSKPSDRKEKPLRILLVEDHESTSRIMTRFLANLGHSVQSAETVGEALRIAHASAGEIDVVLSDLGLPDGTGYELMRELRQRYKLPGIALSGYGMEDDVRQSHDAGFAVHLVKPIDVEQLKSALDEIGAS